MPTPIPNIWQLQQRGDTDALIEALRHPDAGVRRGSAAALRALGAWQTVPALEAALIAEHDWQVHAAISAAIKYLDRDVHIESMVKNHDVQGLIKMLNSPRLEDVITACESLASIGNKAATESLVMLFRNPMSSNKVKLSAAEALLKLESAPAVVTLLGALRRDDWQVRRNAAAVLGQLQAAWATEPLAKTLDDENLTVARTAAAALRRIGSPEALKAASAFEEAQKKLAAEVAAAMPPLTNQSLDAARSGTGNLPGSDTRPMFNAVQRPGGSASESKPAFKLAQTGLLPELPPRQPSTVNASQPAPAEPDKAGPSSPPGSVTKPMIPAIARPGGSASESKPSFKPLAQTGMLPELPRRPGTGPLTPPASSPQPSQPSQAAQPESPRPGTGPLSGITKPMMPAMPRPGTGPLSEKRLPGTKPLQELREIWSNNPPSASQHAEPVAPVVPPSPVPPTVQVPKSGKTGPLPPLPGDLLPAKTGVTPPPAPAPEPPQAEPPKQN